MDREKFIKQAQVLKTKRLRRDTSTSLVPTMRQGVVKIQPIPKNISIPKYTKIFNDRPIIKKQAPKKGCSGCRRNK